MADLVAFEAAVAADLALQFPDAEIHRGERTGKATENPKLAIFWAGDSEQDGRVAVGQARYIVRYWPTTAKIRNDAPAGVRDTSQLQEAKLELQQFFQEKQTAYLATGVWFNRLTRVTPDYDPDEWGVEGELTLWFNNPAAVTA